jgi:DNA-binding transcriptional regulator YhcF (GntR family)
MRQNPDDALVQRLAARLNPNDPTPLYHQIVVAIEREIATGKLVIGAALPSLRTLAAELDVHYHTVRVAFDRLASDGVLRSRPGRQAVVQRAPTVTRRPEAVAEPWAWVATGAAAAGTMLSVGITTNWRVTASPWQLSGSPPPPGIIIVARPDLDLAVAHWPMRERDIHGLDLIAAGATLMVVNRNAERLGVKTVNLVTSDDAGERQLMRQLAVQLPRLGLKVIQSTPASQMPLDHLNCYPPSAWGELSWQDRSHPLVLLLELEFAPGPLAGLARQLHWTPTDE